MCHGEGVLGEGLGVGLGSILTGLAVKKVLSKGAFCHRCHWLLSVCVCVCVCMCVCVHACTCKYLLVVANTGIPYTVPGCSVEGEALAG